MDLTAFKTRVASLAESWRSWLATAIKLLAAFIGTLLTVAFAVIVTAWIVYYGERLLPQTIELAKTSPTEQWSAGKTAHDSIKTWVLHCIKANSVRELPENLQTIFSADEITFFPISSLMNVVRSITDNEKGIIENKRKIPIVQEMNAVQLSYAMRNQRIEIGRKTNESNLELQYIQWITILIGLVTTVVVSVSSTELFGKVDTPLGRGLRFLAIFLPALGTAVAAINAFYNPRDDWNKAANALANLAQLHGQMSIGIWSVKCPDAQDEDSKKPLIAKLDEWTKRYNDIVTIAESNPGSNKQEQPVARTPPKTGGTSSGTTAGAGGAAAPTGGRQDQQEARRAVRSDWPTGRTQRQQVALMSDTISGVNFRLLLSDNEKTALYLNAAKQDMAKPVARTSEA
jgi:hypothetical protein